MESAALRLVSNKLLVYCKKKEYDRLICLINSGFSYSRHIYK